MIMSLHSDALDKECRRLLKIAGYSVVVLPGFEHEIIAEPLPCVAN